ncbi:hypothetical protein GCM10007275_16470 [Jeotgalicoccus coquinae]|uniref:Uncharacterized protein n=1 Tax=Jeotgalicoccus coquinae TaxID=709509 RepID=A0A6V7R0V1_9STAP|nr:hypothetical protein [Jeotgalicoccus coquinae]MBB6423726.1 hypothetical protein [Jeotgalicoccus coquinae]GGE22118.1 hypothetical protein GCM10007275_16470 [Jeotgalicoccus coquinae]CAD2070940.1 hypothetical protein JEOCOQ751_00082 [Jeotgalicoccus coquinae]
MFKYVFLIGSVYISSIIAIVTDFFDGIPWYIQFGPLIVFGGITAIIIILDMNDEEDLEQEETDREPQKDVKKIYFIQDLILLSILIPTVGMNLFFGEPKNDILNIGELGFWIFFAAVPILNRVYIKIMERRFKA